MSRKPLRIWTSGESSEPYVAVAIRQGNKPILLVVKNVLVVAVVERELLVVVICLVVADVEENACAPPELKVTVAAFGERLMKRKS